MQAHEPGRTVRGSRSDPPRACDLAPAYPSSPGWNMKTTRPASSRAMPTERRAAPTSIATWASCPHACMAPSIRERELESRVLGQREGVHVGAQQGRRAGKLPFEHGDDRAHPLALVDLQAQAVDGLEDGCGSLGRSRPISGFSCSSRRSATASSKSSSASATRWSATAGVSHHGLSRSSGRPLACPRASKSFVDRVELVRAEHRFEGFGALHRFRRQRPFDRLRRKRPFARFDHVVRLSAVDRLLRVDHARCSRVFRGPACSRGSSLARLWQALTTT